MDSYSFVMGLADVQALLQLPVLWKGCLYSRKLHYIFVDFEIPFLALFTKLSYRSEISSYINFLDSDVVQGKIIQNLWR